MLEHIAQSANLVYARAILPSQEGLLRTDQHKDITQKSLTTAKDEQTEQLRHEQKIQARRDERRELASYRANNDTPSYSPKHSQSQASQLADKLVEALRQSRQEQTKMERLKSGKEGFDRQSQLNRVYQATNPIQQPRFVDEMA